MPQITCPNCGKTITLENRRKIDFDLIVRAVKREPKNFSDLLRITRLSRKTLSLRLKHLCENGILIRRDGKYDLNGAPDVWNAHEEPFKRVTRIFSDKKMKIGLAMISLMVLCSVSGYGLAVLQTRPGLSNEDQTSRFLGNFTMAVEAKDVNDLYGWQVVIRYNPSELEVLESVPGDFLGTEFVSRNMTDTTIFANKTITEEGTLLLGGCLLGPVPGINGSGRLATIAFGYTLEEYSQPSLVPSAGVFDTFLLNSRLEEMPIANSTLTLSLIEKH